MKTNKLVLCIFIFFSVILLLIVCYLLNINHIEQGSSEVEILGEKVLRLKNEQEEISIPHLNIKGTIRNVDASSIYVELSDYAKTFFETTQILIKNEGFNLRENQRVFIKFNNINVNQHILEYSSAEVYVYVENVDLDNGKKDFFVCPNDYGGFMKVDGTEFKYNNNTYFKSNYDLSENDEVYFVNIKNGLLLIEEIKSIVFPFKIYNMINPQETRFYEIIDIYTNRRSK